MMLPETTQADSSFIDTRPFIKGRSQPGDNPAHNYGAARELSRGAIAGRFAASASNGESPEPDDNAVDTPLEDVARAERDYVRQRLREELQREPTEEEVDQWLREHTEGY
jgi:hypothetical protein